VKEQELIAEEKRIVVVNNSFLFSQSIPLVSLCAHRTVQKEKETFCVLCDIANFNDDIAPGHQPPLFYDGICVLLVVVVSFIFVQPVNSSCLSVCSSYSTVPHPLNSLRHGYDVVKI
jgi:hypothetical protein